MSTPFDPVSAPQTYRPNPKVRTTSNGLRQPAISESIPSSSRGRINMTNASSPPSEAPVPLAFSLPSPSNCTPVPRDPNKVRPGWIHLYNHSIEVLRSDGKDAGEERNSAEKHPFDAREFERGLRSAGYLEMIDVSRKKIKSRFEYALTKEKFTGNLDAFLVARSVKKRGSHMIRFVGEHDVHSPFVHLYTTSIPQGDSTCRIPEQKNNTTPIARTVIWTHLRTTDEGASHWSFKSTGFWAARVVLEGPASSTRAETALEKVVRPGPRIEVEKKSTSSTERPPPREVSKGKRSSQKATGSIHPLLSSESDSTPPTIISSVKQLRVAIQTSLHPTISTSLSGMKQSLKTWSQKDGNREESKRESEEGKRARRDERKRGEGDGTRTRSRSRGRG